MLLRSCYPVTGLVSVPLAPDMALSGSYQCVQPLQVRSWRVQQGRDRATKQREALERQRQAQDKVLQCATCGSARLFTSQGLLAHTEAKHPRQVASVNAAIAAMARAAAAAPAPTLHLAPSRSSASAAAPSSAPSAIKAEAIDLSGPSSPPAKAASGAALKIETIDLSSPSSLPAKAAAVKEEAIDLTGIALEPHPMDDIAALPPAPVPAVQATSARALGPATDQATAGSQGLQAASCPAASYVQPKEETSQLGTGSAPDTWTAMMSSVISHWNK